MRVQEIDEITYSEFANKHMLKSFFQTKEYGELMKYSDYKTMYIGGFDDGELVAASLILVKTMGPNIKYGYAPRGFLIDYYNTKTLTRFTKKVKEFFFRKGYAFIKINPEITFAKLDFENKSKIINAKNRELIKTLKSLGYDKLKDNLYFESLLPKYAPVIYLPNYSLNDLDEEIKNNVAEYSLCGIKLINGKEEDLKTFYSFIENKETKSLKFYKCLFNIFDKHDKCDLVLCEVDYQIYAKYLQKQYVNELEKNDMINNEFNSDPTNEELYNKKLESDKKVAKVASAITYTNKRMAEDSPKEILGAAFIIKHEGRITIIADGYNRNTVNIDVKTFIYYKIIELFKKAGYQYLDLNGITADFKDNNPFKELNDFKLKFKPVVYEYIGELDLIVNRAFHALLWNTNQIQKEFYRPSIKKI